MCRMSPASSRVSDASVAPTASALCVIDDLGDGLDGLRAGELGGHAGEPGEPVAQPPRLADGGLPGGRPVGVAGVHLGIIPDADAR